MLKVSLGGLNSHEDPTLLFAPKQGNSFEIETHSPWPVVFNRVVFTEVYAENV